MAEKKDFKEKAEGIMNDVKDDSELFEKKDIEAGKTMGILSYIGFLVLIPYFAEKNNKYVIYHAKQGLNLFVCEIICAFAIGIISSVLWRLWFITSLIDTLFGIAAFTLSVLGIINVCNGKAKELPIVNKIKIIK